MKKGKLLIGICLLVVAFVLSIAQTVHAAQPINLDGFEDMPSSTTTNKATTETTTGTTNTDNTQTNTNNTASQAKTKMPQTGSNDVVVFGVGMAILSVSAIVIFKKFNGIKLQ